MIKGVTLCVRRTEAIRCAARCLADAGVCITEKCDPDVTHVLLPVPSFSQGDEYLAHLLTKLPDEVTVAGGNLYSPLLENYRSVDFLQDQQYLAANAAITAECALKILDKQFGTDLNRKQVLVIGWGRIGKSLAPLLKAEGADVSVAARKEADLRIIRDTGYIPSPLPDTAKTTHRFDVILNTVPVLLFPQIQTKPDCIRIELASRPGMTGSNIYDGRGLPGKISPMKSGKLIAETFLRLCGT